MDKIIIFEKFNDLWLKLWECEFLKIFCIENENVDWKKLI